ncbi:cilia- and flagella-associated protein 251-like [Culicoides brevitarsis]|uniref:cilia- and flagella-associated protein 251-like n=1 Tax=Culicoides brevitarsis TaxID=469753 RepID=UPI00307CB0C4
MLGNESGETAETNMESSKELLDTPFSLDWVFGRNIKLPIVNLIKNGSGSAFFYVVGHAACIFDAEQNCFVSLLNHPHEINSLDADRARRFLMTSDSRQINIWDSQHRKPLVIHTINYPFDDIGIGAAALSPDAKYLVAGSAKRKCCLKIWLWSYNRDSADGSVNLPSRYGMLKKIRFCQDFEFSHYFVAVFMNGVCFGEWDAKVSKLKVHIPERGFMNCINDAMYMPKTRRVASITNAGQIMLWSDIFPDENETEICNDKEFVKVVKVSGVSLTAIECVDDVIMVGDECGELRFYDKDLRLIYYHSAFDVRGTTIQCIAANVMPRDCKVLETMDFDNCPLRDEDLEKEILYGPLIPRDFSTDEKPLVIRDFLVASGDGRVFSANFMEGEMKEIFQRNMEEILTMDFHPQKNIFYIFSKSGRMMQYHPETKETILDSKIELVMSDRLKTKEEIAGSKLLNDKSDKRPDSGDENTKLEYHYPVQQVTCIKFSKNGIHLMVGTDRGCIYTVDPDSLTTYSPEPYRYTNEPISNMTFSEDSRFFMYSDVTNKVILMYFGVRKWSFVGKNRFHHLPIVDFVAFKMLSTDFSRVLSVGEDQLLVEYDLDQSITQGRLDILSSYRYDQNAVPTSVTYIPPSLLMKLGINTLEYDSVLLITDTDMKIKLVDCNSGSILFTYLGPIFGAPIQQCCFFIKDDMEFLIFSAGNKLGLYLLPIDGNPFRAIGVVASPYNLQKVCVSQDQKQVFTCDVNAFLMWKLHELAVTSHYIAGGSGLEPYCSLLPGGKNGYLFQELLDMFYYIQILTSGMNSVAVNEFIQGTEIVDFMRSVGFFPTDFQIANMLRELELRGAQNITFEQLVVLYLNHKPTKATRGQEVAKAIAYFVRKFVEAEGSQWRTGKQIRNISKKYVIRILTEFAETVDETQAVMCLKELWMQKDESSTNEDAVEEILQRLPEKIDFSKFVDNLVGISFNEEK